MRSTKDNQGEQGSTDMDGQRSRLLPMDNTCLLPGTHLNSS